MKPALTFILLLPFVTSHGANADAMKRVKSKFLVNYKKMCINGADVQELDKAATEKKCACQVNQFDQNLNGDEIIRLFTSKDKLQYPELRTKANALIKQCD